MSTVTAQAILLACLVALAVISSDREERLQACEQARPPIVNQGAALIP